MSRNEGALLSAHERIQNYYAFLDKYEETFKKPFIVVNGLRGNYYEFEHRRDTLFSHLACVEEMMRIYGLSGISLPVFNERSEHEGLAYFRCKLHSDLKMIHHFVSSLK